MESIKIIIHLGIEGITHIMIMLEEEEQTFLTFQLDLGLNASSLFDATKLIVHNYISKFIRLKQFCSN